MLTVEKIGDILERHYRFGDSAFREIVFTLSHLRWFRKKLRAWRVLLRQPVIKKQIYQCTQRRFFQWQKEVSWNFISILYLEKAVTVPKMVAVLYKCPKEIETHRYRLWAAEVITLAETLQHGQGRDIACCGKYIQVCLGFVWFKLNWICS